MKVSTQPRLAQQDPNLRREMVEHATLLNLLTDGRIAGTHNAATAAPASGAYAMGDFVRNSAPAEAGTVGSKYLVLGWVCVDDSPLTFLPCRVLTGN
jgi:hypothetical protein